MERKNIIISSVFILSILAGAAYIKNIIDKMPNKEMVLIPAGEFMLGSNDAVELNIDPDEMGVQQDLFLENEQPVKKVFLKAFKIDKYEITNEEYKFFVDQKNHHPPVTWVNGTYPAGKEKHPVNNVAWFDAADYCEWVGKRLPTEEEWEKAAKGPNNFRYPWGKEFDIKKGNLDKGDTASVGSMQEDKSYYGVYDMAGNVMEWTSSWYNPYSGSKLKSPDYGETNKVLKGWSGTDIGHYDMPFIFARTTARHYYLPYGLGDDFGFRCAQDL